MTTRRGDVILRKAGLVLAIGAIGVLSACSGGGDSGSTGSAATTTTSAIEPTTTTASASCGGATTVEAAVRTSTLAGLGETSDKYDVSGIRVASSDSTWARFDDLPKPGVTDFQGGEGVVHCEGGAWVVHDVGTSEVGCGGGTISPVPEAVRTDLGFECPAP